MCVCVCVCVCARACVNVFYVISVFTCSSIEDFLNNDEMDICKMYLTLTDFDIFIACGRCH